MKKYGVLVITAMVGLLSYLAARSLPLQGAFAADEAPRAADDAAGLAALEGRVAALGDRLAALEAAGKAERAALEKKIGSIESLARGADRKSDLLYAEVGEMKKVVDKNSGDILLLKSRATPSVVNPFGIPRRWEGALPETEATGKCVFRLFPATDPDYLGPVRETFRSDHQVMVLHVVNESTDKIFTFQPTQGRILLVMKDGRQFESLDPRKIFLSKRLGKLEELPAVYKDFPVYPGASQELPILLSSAVDFWEVKEVFFVAGSVQARFMEFNPAKSPQNPAEPKTGN